MTFVPRLEKFLNYLLAFLLPTQLALHFWPSSAFVFGIRVDYLSPTIYLTDILFLTLFINWVRGNWSRFVEFVIKHKKYLIPLLIIALINIDFSVSPQPSTYKWIKVFELLVFGYYVWVRKEVFGTKTFLNTIYYSLLFFSVIGITQFFIGKTLGGAFYLFGERSFDITTPGIALTNVMGRVFMRAYSTFSHPNSFAGYLFLGTTMLLLGWSKQEIVKKKFGLLLIILAIFLTFSLSAIVGILFCWIIYLLLTCGKLSFKNNVAIVSTIFLVSIISSVVSKPIKESALVLSNGDSQRLDLSFKAGKIISNNFLLGSGLNTFVVTQPTPGYSGNLLWLLQPVHNICLLVFSETGVIGLICLFVFIIKLFQKAFVSKNYMLIISIFFVLITGLFDHYWFTLQQNMLILAIVLGNGFREKT